MKGLFVIWEHQHKKDAEHQKKEKYISPKNQVFFKDRWSIPRQAVPSNTHLLLFLFFFQVLSWVQCVGVFFG